MELNDENRMFKIASYVGKAHIEKLKFYSKKYKLPISRLIAIAVDNEIFDCNLDTEMPFYWNTKIPENDFVENTYADEAGKLVKFLKMDSRGMSLDILLVLRHEVGIPDKEKLLLALRECLDHNLLEAFNAPKSVKYGKEFPEVTLYRLKTSNPKVTKKVRRTDAQEYAEMLRLKKKFGEV